MKQGHAMPLRLFIPTHSLSRRSHRCPLYAWGVNSPKTRWMLCSKSFVKWFLYIFVEAKNILLDTAYQSRQLQSHFLFPRCFCSIRFSRPGFSGFSAFCCYDLTGKLEWGRCYTSSLKDTPRERSFPALGAFDAPWQIWAKTSSFSMNKIAQKCWSLPSWNRVFNIDF